jgi:flagellar hook assembly protein FlgD
MLESRIAQLSEVMKTKIKDLISRGQSSNTTSILNYDSFLSFYLAKIK